MFCEFYKGFKLSKEYNLENNTMFIQTEVYGTSGMGGEFSKVNIDKEVEFVITSDEGTETGITVVTYVYFVAIIPNTTLNGVNTNQWKSPIFLNNSLRNEYVVVIESDNLDFKTSLNIIEKKVSDVGNIKIQQYHYSLRDNVARYMLISYDKTTCNQLIQNINTQVNGMQSMMLGASQKDETEYKKFQETLNQSATLDYRIDLWSDSINNYTSWRNYTTEGRRNSKAVKG